MKTRFRRGRTGSHFITDKQHPKRRKTESAHHRHHKKQRRLAMLIAGLVILAGIIGGTVYYLRQQIKQESDDATQNLQEIITVKDPEGSQRTVASKYGMHVRYNSDLLEAQGHKKSGNGWEVVSNQDLNNKDSYAILEFTLKTTGSSESLSNRFGNIYGPKLTISTNLNKNFFEDGKKKYGADKSNEDLIVLQYAPQKTDTSTPELTKTEEETIGGIKYKKLTYEITDTKFLTSKNDIVLYVTVQNNRPYTIQLDATKQTTQSDLAPLMQAINGTSYSQPDPDTEEKVTFENLTKAVSKVLGTSTDKEASENNSGEIPQESVNTPKKLVDGTALKVVAKNQPAVVRIASQTCFDYNVISSNKKVAIAAKEACMAGIGSGSIVSADGYISTNGHVARFKPADTLIFYIITKAQAGDYKPRDAYLQYLVDEKIMNKTELNNLIEALQKGDEAAVQKLLYSAELIPKENFQVVSSSSEYAIQLGNEPIKAESINTSSKINLKYTDKVVKANFVDADYDEYAGKEGKHDLNNATSSDVAILKIENQKKFPVVRLGGIDTLKRGSLITIIGYPGFVDGGLETKKEKTIPSATQGRVEDIFDDSKGPNARKMVATNALGAQGNSGGPAFSDNGQVVGLLSNGGDPNDPEAGVTKFSATGILRDIADYKALLAKNKLSLNTSSSISENWDKAIDEFSQARYKNSMELFKKVQDEYPAHYLAESFIKVSESKVGKGEDVSSKSSFIVVLAGAFVIVIVAVGFTVVILIKHRKHGKAMGYTGYPPPTPAGIPNMYPAGYPQQPVSQGYTTPPNYQQPNQNVYAAPQSVAPGQPAIPHPSTQPQNMPTTNQPYNNTPPPAPPPVQ